MAATSSVTAIDSLFKLYFYAALVVGGIVLLAFLYALFRYRDTGKEPEDAPRAGVIPPIRGTAKMGLLLAAVLFVLFVPISIGTKDTVNFIEKPPAEEALIIKVEGAMYSWSFTYPNGKRTIGELVVPKDKVIVLEVTAKDVFHNFYVPDFKLMADSIPGQTNVVWFKATQTGSYKAHCNEICGVGHTVMKATVTVKEPQEFQNWYAGGK